MQKSDSHKAKKAHRTAQASTTLNRKYVARPESNSEVNVNFDRSPVISHFSQQDIQPSRPSQTQLQSTVNQRMRARNDAMQKKTQATKTASAKELKDRAIKKALAAANVKQAKAQDIKAKKSNKIHFGFGRVMLALACTTAAVFAIVYFVNLNMPDLSLRVAAMQTGIDASYPSYIPRGYTASSITSESGKITMNFSNPDGGTFTIIEEKSSWDSSALLSNYIEPEYGNNYTIVREQGLSLYISGSNAAWVNGGKIYKIITTSGSLTNKQIRGIAASL